MTNDEYRKNLRDNWYFWLLMLGDAKKRPDNNHYIEVVREREQRAFDILQSLFPV
jgi:hypothetical protein